MSKNTLVRWVESLLRAIIAGLAGIGVACVTNHFARRPNVAYFASIVATGVIVAILNHESRSEASATPPEESGTMVPPKMPIAPVVATERAADPAPSSPYPERQTLPLRRDTAARQDGLSLESETSAQSSSTTTHEGMQ